MASTSEALAGWIVVFIALFLFWPLGILLALILLLGD